MRTITFWLALFLVFTIPMEGSLEKSTLGSISSAAGLLLVLAWFATVLYTGQFSRWHLLHFTIILFVAWNAVSVFWSVDVLRTRERAITYAQLGLMVFILCDLLDSPKKVKWALQAYVLGTYVSIAGILFNFVLQNSIGATHARFSAGNFDPNNLGLRIVIAIPIAWYLASDTSQTRVGDIFRKVNYLYVPLAMFAAVLTGSRTAFLAIIPCVLFILVSLTRLSLVSKIVAFSLIVGALFALQPLVPASTVERLAQTQGSIADGNLSGRVAIWQQGLEIFYDHPILGVGSGAFRSANPLGKPPHNTFLSIAAETGIIGIVFFAIIMGVVLRNIMLVGGWDAQLWLVIFAIWGAAAFSLDWSFKKPTWLIIGLAVAYAATMIQGMNIPNEQKRYFRKVETGQ